MRVRPRAGVIVRDPETKQPVPASGRDVPRSTYWMRQLLDGDLELVPDNEPDRATEHAQHEEPK